MTGEQFFRELSARKDSSDMVLATVRHVSGSTPRYAGAQMACGDDWSLGTIGGGLAEAKVIQAARSTKPTTSPTEVIIDLRGTVEEPRDGICGGKMIVRLDTIDQVALESIERGLKMLQSGEPVQQYFPADDSWFLQATDKIGEAEGLTDPQYVFPDPLLLIVGGGHCGTALAQAALPLGFHIVIQDDRTICDGVDWSTERCIKSCDSVAKTLLNHQSSRPLYAAIVSRSYACDVAALEALATVECHYVGLMGSNRRVAQVQKMLRDRGVCQAFLERVDSPIGLVIGAETPEEIAISICARLIEVRQQHKFMPASFE